MKDNHSKSQQLNLPTRNPEVDPRHVLILRQVSGFPSEISSSDSAWLECLDSDGKSLLEAFANVMENTKAMIGKVYMIFVKHMTVTCHVLIQINHFF
jgi:hypothetical protein